MGCDPQAGNAGLGNGLPKVTNCERKPMTLVMGWFRLSQRPGIGDQESEAREMGIRVWRIVAFVSAYLGLRVNVPRLFSFSSSIETR